MFVQQGTMWGGGGRSPKRSATTQPILYVRVRPTGGNCGWHGQEEASGGRKACATE